MHALLLLLFLQQIPQDTTTDSKAVELFQDPLFQRGFVLTADRHPVPKVQIGVLQTAQEPASQEPAWQLAQWGTRHLLQPGACEPLGDDAWQAETPGKRVLIQRTPDGAARFVLETRGITEYAGQMRKSGESWPHVLIEQGFKPPVRLSDSAAFPFALEMRIPFCKAAPWAEGQLDPGLHTAQVSAYWTIHNVNPDSADHGDMIWFGIPFFDVRNTVPPGHYAIDGGQESASGKFICSLDGARFWKGATGDGEWRKLDVDLLSLLHEALKIAQEHGHMLKTRAEDLGFTSFNLGWEIPGPYDAALEVRGLTFKRVPR